MPASRRVDHDVLIVGGGPAGLYAAQRLARRGLSVLVLEEHDRIGEPVHCTGIVGAEVLDLPGVPRDVVIGVHHRARFHSPAGRRLAYAGSAGEVVVVDRGAFDRGLARAAEAAGATVRTGARVLDLSVESDSAAVEVTCGGSRERLRARACLLACGASYRFQRRLGWGVPPLALASAQTEAASPPDTALDIFLRRDLAPIGFGWSVPISRNGQSRAKVGVMARRGARASLERLLADLRADGRVVGAVGPVSVRMLPLAPLARTYGDRVLAIGDAAGLAKPTTGGGIYYSLLTATWAAEAVTAAIERGDCTAPTFAAYELAWRSHLGAEMKVGVWFRRLASRFSPDDLDRLVEIAGAGDLMPIVRRAARFNWHRELILRSLRHPEVLRLVTSRMLRGAEPDRSTA